jgi:CRP-like cAMP-binding protein
MGNDLTNGALNNQVQDEGGTTSHNHHQNEPRNQKDDARTDGGSSQANGPGDLASLLRDQADEFGEHLTLSQGDVLVREGDESDKIYVVIEGEIGVSIRNQSGDEVTVACIGAGKVIGEMTLFGESKRSATCRAASAVVQLIAISNEKALEIIDRNTDARRGLVMELTRRSRSMLQYINEFSHLTELISAGDYGSVQAQINLSGGSSDGTLKAARSAFAAMLTKIKEREAELQSKIQSLTIQIDQARAAKEIQDITSDSMFQSLQENSASLRARMKE